MLVRIVLLCSSLVVFLSCSPRSATVDLKFTNGKAVSLPLSETLRIAFLEPLTMDWQLHDDRLKDSLMEGLLGFDFSSSEPKLRANLASAWETENNGRVWKFKIREGVKWTDGVPFTAEQIVSSWKRLLDPKFASDVAYFLFAIKNARAFNSGKIAFEEVGIKFTPAGEVIVELEAPTAFFPWLLTNACTFPVRVDLIEKYGPKWTEPGNLVTLGAFKLVAYQKEKAMVLERNETYFGEKAKTKNLVIYFVPEHAARLNLFEAGQIDFEGYLPATTVKAYLGKPEIHKVKELNLQYLGFVQNKPGMLSLDLRKAIAHGIERDSIVAGATVGGIALSGVVPEGMFGHEAKMGLQTSYLKAKQFLAKAPKPKFLELMIYNGDEHRLAAEILQAQLKKNLGLEVRIQQLSFKEMRARLRSNPPDMYVHGWSADFPDPDNFYSLFDSGSGNNHARFKNAEYDALIASGRGTTNDLDRVKIYRKAGQLLTESEVAVVPLFSYTLSHLVSPRVKGFSSNALGKIFFKDVEIVK